MNLRPLRRPSLFRAARPLAAVPLAAVPLAALIALAALWPGAAGSQGELRSVAFPGMEAPPAQPPARPGPDSTAGDCGLPREVELLYPFSGELHLEATDLEIPGRGIDFVWARKYRSRLGPGPGPNGAGQAQGKNWDFSYNIWVDERPQGMLVQDGNTRRDYYRLRPDGTYAADEHFREGHIAPDLSFVLTFADGGEWRFQPFDGAPHEGRIREIRDRNGNALTFGYDALGRLEAVTDTLGRLVLVAYDADGTIESVSDWAGRAVTYEHYRDGDAGGSAGDLKSVTTPAVTGTPNGNDFPNGRTTVYTYTSGLADERLNHNLLTITDPLGQTFLRVEYAAGMDRVARLFHGSGTEVTDLVLVPQTPGPGNGGAVVQAILNDRVGNVSERFYDLRNRCVLLREFTGRAIPDQPTSETANRPANPLRPDDPPCFETRFCWNVDSRLTRTVHPRGNVTERLCERDLDAGAAPRTRGNLRILHRLAGALPCNDPPIVETFEYEVGQGGCCGSSFVTRHVDANGNETLHQYDANGNRTHTQHAIPTIEEDFAYDAFGRLVEHIHPDNGSGWRRKDRYSYYGPADGAQNGYLKEEIVDADGLALTTSYEYDAAGNAVRVVDARGNDSLFIYNQLDEIVRETSRETEPGSGLRYIVDTYYDANGNVVRVDSEHAGDPCTTGANPFLTTTSEYEVLNELVRTAEEVDDGYEVVTEYEHDANRNVVLVRKGEAVEGNQPANVVQTQYDERDLLFRKTLAPGDPSQSTAQHDYDANGNLVRLVEGLEAGSQAQTTEHDCFDRPVLFTDAMGNVTASEYDANGNLVLFRTEGELQDQPGSSANVRLSEVAHVYDPMNRLVRTKAQHFDPATQQPIGDGLAVTELEYNGGSQVTRLVDDGGNATATAYDTAGRRLEVVDARGNRTTWSYDANDNVVALTETELSDTGAPAQTYLTTYEYDNLDRRIRTTDSAGQVWLDQYDSRGARTRSVDPLGNVVCMSYDGLQRLVATTRWLTDDGTGGGNPSGQIVTTQGWDASSRLVAQTDDIGNATAYQYDALDRLVAIVHADGTVWQCSYDVHGNRVATLDANGTLVTSVVDDLGRVTLKQIAPGPGVSDDTTFESFAYDGQSRLVRAQDDDSLVERAYDSLSNLWRETQDGAAITYAHDGRGNVLAAVYPGGRALAYSHDALGRRKTIGDGLGPIASYDYVGPKRVERRRYTREPLSSITSSFQYDADRRAVLTSHLPESDLPPIDIRTYAWDLADHKLQQADVRAGGPRLAHDYVYDSAYRLVRTLVTDGAGNPVRDTQYDLDGAGNRTAVSGDACPGTYVLDPTLPEPADLQMNQYTRTPCDAGRSYDAEGNPIAIQVGPTAPRALIYDYADRLVAHVDPDLGLVATYAYDALGRRIGRSVGTADVTRHLHDGWQVCEERDAAGTVVATYVWGVGPDELLLMSRGGAEHYLYANDLGSIVALGSTSGHVLERYEYGDYGEPAFLDPAGNPLSESAYGNPYLFTGRRFDPETGFYDFRTRYLDPFAGRFLTRDTIGIWADGANLGNGTAYVANDPATFVDPFGRKRGTHNCDGRALKWDTKDCGATSRYRIVTAACSAWKAVRRASDDVDELVSHDWRYGRAYQTTAIARTRANVDTWFGGGDGSTSYTTKGKVGVVLTRVESALRKHRIKAECEGSSNRICRSGAGGSGASAYVYEGATRVHLCPSWLGTSMTTQRRAAVFFHELTHGWAGTDDKGYVRSACPSGYRSASNSSRCVTLSESKLRKNADTYEEFLFQNYVR